jgi:hypothetical protein
MAAEQRRDDDAKREGGYRMLAQTRKKPRTMPGLFDV